jgi:hypothetical protein
MYVNTFWRCTSNSTRPRLYRWGKIQLETRTYPIVNGYKTNPYKAWTLNTHQCDPVHFDGNLSLPCSYGDHFIKIVDRIIDLDTVVAPTIEIVEKAKELKRLSRHLGKALQIMRMFEKMGGLNRRDEGTVSTEAWIEMRLKEPPNDIRIDPLPEIGYRNSTFSDAIKATWASMRWRIAVREGMLCKKEMPKTWPI